MRKDRRSTFSEDARESTANVASSDSRQERANLTLRMMQKRFARVTLGFSNKAENLRAAVALHFAYYNFIWVPRTTGKTPAMMAGLTNQPWNIGDLVA